MNLTETGIDYKNQALKMAMNFRGQVKRSLENYIFWSKTGSGFTGTKLHTVCTQKFLGVAYGQKFNIKQQII